jgi:hypothetical protein
MKRRCSIAQRLVFAVRGLCVSLGLLCEALCNSFFCCYTKSDYLENGTLFFQLTFVANWMERFLTLLAYYFKDQLNKVISPSVL